MAWSLFSLAYKWEKNGKLTCAGPLLSALMGAYVVMGLILTIIFFLNVTLLMSPDFLRRFLQDFMQCEDFPGYLSPDSTRADTVEYSRHTYFSSEMKDSVPSTPIISSSDHNASLANVTNQAFENGSLLASSPGEAPLPAKFSVLIGILTKAEASARRHELRLAYAVQSSDDAAFTVRFVLGALEKEEDRIWVGMENATFGDIFVLPCKENMNAGKTFAYFTTVVAIGLKYDYVMKTDDDSYIRFSNLGKQLSPMPRTDLYYGYSLPCDVDRYHAHFIAGAGYMISWDLVLWINNSPIPRNRSIGTEDILVGDWFRDGGVAKNRPFTKGLFYDHPDQGGQCAHELTDDTVLVHKLKTSKRWGQVLAFFEKDRLQSMSLNNQELKLFIGSRVL